MRMIGERREGRTPFDAADDVFPASTAAGIEDLDSDESRGFRDAVGAAADYAGDVSAVAEVVVVLRMMSSRCSMRKD
jgi:hypothetical protein